MVAKVLWAGFLLVACALAHVTHVGESEVLQAVTPAIRLRNYIEQCYKHPFGVSNAVEWAGDDWCTHLSTYVSAAVLATIETSDQVERAYLEGDGNDGRKYSAQPLQPNPDPDPVIPSDPPLVAGDVPIPGYGSARDVINGNNGGLANNNPASALGKMFEPFSGGNSNNGGGLLSFRRAKGHHRHHHRHHSHNREEGATPRVRTHRKLKPSSEASKFRGYRRHRHHHHHPDGESAAFLELASETRNPYLPEEGNGAKLRWPMSLVTYAITTKDGKHHSMNEEEVETTALSTTNQINTHKAHAIWEAATCVDFFEEPNEDNVGDGLLWYAGTKKAGVLGSTSPGWAHNYKDDISACELLQTGPDAPNGGVGVRTVVHETGHALGVFHTQSRKDRDDFFLVQDAVKGYLDYEIKDKFEFTYGPNMRGPKFDIPTFPLPAAWSPLEQAEAVFESVMCYGYSPVRMEAIGKHFASNPITPQEQSKVDYFNNHMGKWVKLGRLDIMLVNDMYQCQPLHFVHEGVTVTDVVYHREGRVIWQLLKQITRWRLNHGFLPDPTSFRTYCDGSQAPLTPDDWNVDVPIHLPQADSLVEVKSITTKLQFFLDDQYYLIYVDFAADSLADVRQVLWDHYEFDFGGKFYKGPTELDENSFLESIDLVDDDIISSQPADYTNGVCWQTGKSIIVLRETACGNPLSPVINILPNTRVNSPPSGAAETSVASCGVAETVWVKIDHQATEGWVPRSKLRRVWCAPIGPPAPPPVNPGPILPPTIPPQTSGTGKCFRTTGDTVKIRPSPCTRNDATPSTIGSIPKGTVILKIGPDESAPNCRLDPAGVKYLTWRHIEYYGHRGYVAAELAEPVDCTCFNTQAKPGTNAQSVLLRTAPCGREDSITIPLGKLVIEYGPAVPMPVCDLVEPTWRRVRYLDKVGYMGDSEAATNPNCIEP